MEKQVRHLASDTCPMRSWHGSVSAMSCFHPWFVGSINQYLCWQPASRLTNQQKSGRYSTMPRCQSTAIQGAVLYDHLILWSLEVNNWCEHPLSTPQLTGEKGKESQQKLQIKSLAPHSQVWLQLKSGCHLSFGAPMLRSKLVVPAPTPTSLDLEMTCTLSPGLNWPLVCNLLSTGLDSDPRSYHISQRSANQISAISTKW